MIPCKQCLTVNSLDSSFCKHCGTPLTQEDLQEAKSIVARRISQGFVLFNENHIDEAFAIAEQTVKDDPASAEAFSLLAMCQERRGQLGEALQSYERVVDLNPDSSLDRVKVVHLRKVIAGYDFAPGKPTTKVALVAGLVAGLFVVSLGAAWITMSLRKSETDAGQAVAQKGEKQTMTPFSSTPANSSAALGTVAAADPKPDSTKEEEKPQPKVKAAETQPVTPQAAPHVTPGPSSSAGTPILPAPVESQNPNELKPLHVNLQPNPPIGAQPGSRTQASLDPDPKPQIQSTAESQQQALDSGVVEINLSQPKRQAVGGSEILTDPKGLQALQHAATSQFQLKHYDAAARSYERLLRAGGDPAAVNQRLAQCYENLGKKVDASIAYQRAIVALENNLNAGRGNSSREKVALEACRQALKVLQGS